MKVKKFFKDNWLLLVAGLVVGLVAKKFKFTLVTALVTGLALSVICPAIGTPIGVFVYGGLAGNVLDVVITGLVKSGQKLFAASFITKIGSNLIDKVGTCLVAYFLLKAMPARFLSMFKGE